MSLKDKVARSMVFSVALLSSTVFGSAWGMNLLDEEPASRSPQPLEQSVSLFTEGFPASPMYKMMNGLTGQELHDFALTSKKHYTLCGQYAMKAASKVIHSYFGNKSLSQQKQDRLVDILSHVHEYNESQKTPFYTVWKRIEDEIKKKGPLIVKKNRSHLLERQILSSNLRKSSLLTTIPHEELTHLLPDFSPFVGDETSSERLHLAALQHALSQFWVYDQKEGMSQKPLVQALQDAGDRLKAAPKNYGVFSDLPSFVTSDANYLLITQEEFADAGNWWELEALFADHPDRTLILDVAGKTLDLDGANLPATVKHLAMTNAEGQLTSLFPPFLSGAKSIETFDSSGLTAVTFIGDFFIGQANSLQTFDGSGFAALKTVGRYFLYAAHSLKIFDSSGLTALTSIGDRFLYAAHSLKIFDSSGLTAVTSIGTGFLYKIHNLEAFDSSGFTAVTSIGTGWGHGTTNESLRRFGMSHFKSLPESQNL